MRTSTLKYPARGWTSGSLQSRTPIKANGKRPMTCRWYEAITRVTPQNRSRTGANFSD